MYIDAYGCIYYQYHRLHNTKHSKCRVLEYYTVIPEVELKHLLEDALHLVAIADRKMAEQQVEARLERAARVGRGARRDARGRAHFEALRKCGDRVLIRALAHERYAHIREDLAAIEREIKSIV